MHCQTNKSKKTWKKCTSAFHWPLIRNISNDKLSRVVQRSIVWTRLDAQQFCNQRINVYRIEWRNCVVSLDVWPSCEEDWLHRLQVVVVSMSACFIQIFLLQTAKVLERNGSKLPTTWETGRFWYIEVHEVDNFCDLVCPSLQPLWKGVYSKRKECDSDGRKLFLFRVNPFSEGREKWKKKKLPPLKAINFP